MTLTMREVDVRYGARIALRPTSLELAPGELVALVGPNGAGKSSLLKALAGVLPHGGSVMWQGTPLEKLDARHRARSLAYLPQAPTFHWPMQTRDLVALGRLPHRAYGAAPSDEDRLAVEWALEETETTALGERGIDRLSVGERARVLLARALAVRAPVLLVDEPIAMLDPYHQLQIMSVLRAYARGSAEIRPIGGPARSGALVIAVLHDLALAARFCSRVLLMDGGAVVDDGVPERTLSAAAVRRHYRVEPLITSHAGEPLIVPWRRLDD
jgi:iron complex transport system ATP-binding protein